MAEVEVAAFPASLAGGLLWHYVSPAATFWYGAPGALLAAMLLFIFLPAKELADD